MNTSTLPGWLQVVLVLLVGVVGWLLLRPYRRLTQLGGKDHTRTVTDGSWHRRFFRDARAAARLDIAEEELETRRSSVRRGLEPHAVRPEGRTEDVTVTRPGGLDGAPVELEPRRTPPPRQRRPESGRPAGDWTEPDVPTAPSNYSIYRPASTSPSPAETDPRPVRRPESSPVGG
jgi:hypothetical protein